MHEGTITAVYPDRGFGFIHLTNSPDVFFHVQDLCEDLPFDKTLQERRVAFEIVGTSRGPRAKGIRAAD